MAYPGYGAPPQAGYAMGQQQQDPLYGFFSSVAGQDGQISAEELQRCLTQCGMAGSYKPFNLETCRLMINMLDRDMSGSMGFTEFKELAGALNGWKQNFVTMDRDRSGTIEAQEMQQALGSMGYNFSPQSLGVVLRRHSTHGRIAFDDYVACCVRLRSLTDHFRRRDSSQQGTAAFQYDDFIQVTMSS
ncbi:sorcin isoform X1 [Gadus morhua]|uniref:sorcin isoform X1 n=1 Tax=Gadus morhua TaxID=8049 RepID=UPI0011B73F5F|nr:sorcin-like isoform X1 [Gadus morhua]XP_056457265.1 sorcin-like isoform X1 [Gadus chalcogrammus]XP_056457269.1 sorcin-like isoform X1 [Gadus chalcogrammus]XP_059920216.1 sorcin isoform X2 [Gadus macrocephalus]